MEKFINHKMKTTSIGLIPEDWEAKSLSQIGAFSKGKGVTRANAQSGDIPCIRYGEIYTSHNDYIRSFYSHISPEVAATATKLKKGDVLFAGSGETKEEIGKAVAFLGEEDAYAGGDIIILSPNEGASSKYLGYVLNAATAVNQKSSMGQGDAVVHIHAKELGDVVIPFPKFDEQEKIADALSGVDDMIGALDEAIAKKRQIKDGLMQQLLTGKTRLPGFNGEWEDIPFKSIYKYAKEGGTPSTGVAEYYNPAIVPFAKIEDLKDKYLTRVESYISESGVEHSSAWLIPVNSVILSNGATLGEVSINKITTTTKQGILGIILKEDFSPEFIYYLFKGRSFRREMEKVTTHGTMDCAYLKDLNTISLRIPPLTEQEAIASVISSVDKKIVGLESQRDKYALIKQGMMQELLTGKTRLI